MQKSFFFEGTQIHRINQVQEDQKYVIQIGSSHFRYSKSQLAFLSNRAFKHFRNSQSPFEICLPDQLDSQFNFGLNDLISCFQEIDPLFRSETEIILQEDDIPTFKHLSRFLDKKTLCKTCKNVQPNTSPIFK
jgi:hypothetical protein